MIQFSKFCFFWYLLVMPEHFFPAQLCTEAFGPGIFEQIACTHQVTFQILHIWRLIFYKSYKISHSEWILNILIDSSPRWRKGIWVAPNKMTIRLLKNHSNFTIQGRDWVSFQKQCFMNNGQIWLIFILDPLLLYLM